MVELEDASSIGVGLAQRCGLGPPCIRRETDREIYTCVKKAYATRGAGGGRPLGGPRAVSADADRESALYSELRKYLLLCCAVSHRTNSNRCRHVGAVLFSAVGFFLAMLLAVSPRPSIPRHSKTQGNSRYRAISHLPSPSRLSSLPSAFSSPFRVGSTYCQKTELHTMAARMSLPLSLASVDPSSS